MAFDCGVGSHGCDLDGNSSFRSVMVLYYSPGQFFGVVGCHGSAFPSTIEAQSRFRGNLNLILMEPIWAVPVELPCFAS